MITSLGVVCAPICPTLSISSNEHMEHMKNVAIYLHGTIKGVLGRVFYSRPTAASAVFRRPLSFYGGLLNVVHFAAV